MDIEELRAKAAWVYALTGNKYSLPVKNIEDLRSYVASVEFRYQNKLTEAQLKQLHELGESVLRAQELQRVEGLRQFNARWEWSFNRGKALSRIGASARREMGEQTRHKIIRLWKRLASMPKRERARHIAASCQLTDRHVRRVMRALGLE
jgi:hypothetical protein